MTKKISLDFQGSYTLIYTSITLLVIFFGLDFYIYSNKVIIRDKGNAIFYLKNNLTFYFFVYLLFIPAFYLIAAYRFQNLGFNIGLLFILVIVEHLGQEFFRMYIALQKVYLANIILFIRSGLWSIVLVVYMSFLSANISIDDILQIWLASSSLALLISFYFFPEIKFFFRQKTDLVWIKKGLNIALQMFLATIFLKVIEFSDRYILDIFYDKETVGIYAFYFQLANLANVVIFTLYISFLYPKLIESIYNKTDLVSKKIRKEIRKKTIIVISTTIVTYSLILNLLLEFIEREQLFAYKPIVFCLLISGLFFNLSYAGHYTLIGQNREKTVLKITVICFVVNISLNFILIYNIGIWGAVWSQIATALTMYFLKDRSIVNVKL